MKRTDVICPSCRKVNWNLFLEETAGRYECIWCGYCGMIPECMQDEPNAMTVKREASETTVCRERITPLTAYGWKGGTRHGSI